MRILIVDDDPLTLKVLSDALSVQPGCETETAGSGLEALCRVLIGDIDLAITDWQMPGMNGLDLCRNNRKCGLEKYVYVVLITGHGDAKSVIEGLNAGADEFLTKPVGPYSGTGHDAPSNTQPCLGLAYCQTVTAAHEGRISCKSNQPTGTRFEIRLPVSSTDSGELFDPVAFASTLPQDEILSIIAGDEEADDADIETAVDSRLALVPGPDSPLPS